MSQNSPMNRVAEDTIQAMKETETVDLKPTNLGLATQQVFPADQHTREIIEPAHANVWRIEVIPGERFSYHLRRLGTERVFRVDFDLTDPIETPPAPWGWVDDSP